MTTRTEKYWQQRFEQVTEAQLKTGMDYYDEAERLYREAMESIEKDIARWYMRLAVNNQITYADAKKLLTNLQLKDFKLTLKEYIKRGKENGISADWSKSLENASAKYHISRLEALQIQIQQHLEALYGNQLDGMDAAMRKIYSDGYYQTAYELQKGFSTGFDVQQIDDARLERLMSKPWAADGQNFSQRLWSDKDKLINNLQNELVQGLVRGDAQLKIVQSFAKRMNTSLSNAGRLIATESAYFASLGEKDGMKDLGVDQYEILATLDRKTSDICRSMDGKVFKMSEFKAGVTAPPLHPWCRSCTVPHIEGLDSGLRAARDDDGKVYYVPGSMKYPEWKEKFVDGGSKEDLQEVTAKKEHIVVEGKNVAGKWERRPEQFKYEIDDIIDYQGFNGLPRLVNAKDFKKLVEEDHFIAKRVYAASSKEELNSYMQQLRSGEWYINCSVGGAQYGQGMYCAADYTKGSLVSAIDKEMAHYTNLGVNRGKKFAKVEQITLDKSAKIFNLPEKCNRITTIQYVAAEYINQNPEMYGINPRYINEFKNLSKKEQDKNTKIYISAWKALCDEIFHRKRDPGAVLAELGYDAINARGHGVSGSYTVILNRTKLILLDE